MVDRRGASVLELLVGGLVGAAAGVIIAVNIVIFSGIDQGYESSLPDVFEYNFAIGATTVAALIAGPIIGWMAARHIGRS